MKLTTTQLNHTLHGLKSLQYLAEYAEWVWYKSGAEIKGTVYSEIRKK